MGKRSAEAPSTKPKGTVALNYLVLCISMYCQDVANMDRMVRELKARGVTWASRSMLIRYALRRVDVDEASRNMLSQR